MNLASFLINATFAAYVASTFAYLFHAVTRKKGAHAVALVILIAGLALNTASIVERAISAGYPPFTNMYESMVFFGWCVACAYIVTERVVKIQRIGWLVTVFAALTIAYASFMADAQIKPLVPALKSNWLTIHVISYFAAYAVLTVSFVSSIVFLQGFRQGRVALRVLMVVTAAIYWLAYGIGIVGDESAFKSWVMVASVCGTAVLAALVIWLRPAKVADREPSEKFAGLTHKSVLFAFPLLTLGLLTGAVLAQNAWSSYWSWDPKETWSLITWLTYLNFLHLRYTVPGLARSLGWSKDAPLVVENVFAFCGFLLNLFTYVGVNFLLAGLHVYAKG
jgi:cytochrome c-type biogenesis protein CcsB